MRDKTDKRIEVDKNKIIREISNKLKISYDQVEEAVNAQFKFVGHVMKEGNRETQEFDNIRLPYFGVFKVIKGRLKHLNKEKK